MDVCPREDIAMEDAVDEDAEMCQGSMHCQCDRCAAKKLREAQQRVEGRAMTVRRMRVKGLDQNRHKRKLNTISEHALLLAETLSVNDMTPEQKNGSMIGPSSMSQRRVPRIT